MSENVHFDCNKQTPRRNTWLNEFERNITSQSGEDGIIEKVLDVIDENDKWCVEFGSWDGKTLSNTYNLIHNKGYSAVMIEGDFRRFQDLLKIFDSNEKVIKINMFVGFEPHNCLDKILETTEIPTNFDLLSIDVDGNDYHIWEMVIVYKPKVVVIEFNQTIPSCVEFVQPRDMSVSQGSSLLSIDKLAKRKGYELVAVTVRNAVFVDKKYFGLFGIQDNSVATMRINNEAVTYIFCGYDGTVFIRGCGELPNQKIRYRESKMQQLPKWARKRVGDSNIIRKKLGKLFRRLRKRNII